MSIYVLLPKSPDIRMISGDRMIYENFTKPVSVGALDVHIRFYDVLALRAVDKVVCEAVVNALFAIFLLLIG